MKSNSHVNKGLLISSPHRYRRRSVSPFPRQDGEIALHYFRSQQAVVGMGAASKENEESLHNDKNGGKFCR